eukprot:TRINITY_DN12824_c0_g1_i1.p1 TRINITY_DN12824_c0_g1~~TRINITY_DN12824_c0_g1_i1.p1  ORF type:complete len:115 (+),score=27.25 TRINITY_DN12824_c0_g1_i1:80-424(+)
MSHAQQVKNSPTRVKNSAPPKQGASSPSKLESISPGPHADTADPAHDPESLLAEVRSLKRQIKRKDATIKARDDDLSRKDAIIEARDSEIALLSRQLADARAALAASVSWPRSV